MHTAEIWKICIEFFSIGINISHYIGVFVLGFPLSFN